MSSAVSTATQAIVKKPSLVFRATKKVKDYFNQLAEDYKTVFVESVEDIPKYPVRSFFFMTTVGAIIGAVSTNPTEKQMLERLAEWRLEMGLVPNLIHSTVADSTLIDRTQMLNQNRYNYYNCLLFSLILRRNYDSKVGLYAAQDSNLKDWPWNRLVNNFVDIGIFNRFWFLEKAFENYDIKQEEFETEKPII